MEECRQNLINENDLTETMKIKTPEMNIKQVNHMESPPTETFCTPSATKKMHIVTHKESNEDGYFSQKTLHKLLKESYRVV